MKTKSFLVAAGLCAAIVSSVSAAGAGASAYEGSLLTWDSGKRLEPLYDGGLNRLSFEGYGLNQTRGMDFVCGGEREWSVTHVGALLGWDLTRWLTIKAGGGGSALSVSGTDYDSGGEWVVGGQLRLLDYWMLEPLVAEEPYWLSVDVNGRYLMARAEAAKDELTWHEAFGSVVFSLVARPERWGFVDRIGIFAGPAYSEIVADEGGGFGADVTANRTFGFVGGLFLNPNNNVTLKAEVQAFDKVSVGGSIGFHF